MTSPLHPKDIARLTKEHNLDTSRGQNTLKNKLYEASSDLEWAALAYISILEEEIDELEREE